MLQGSHLHEDNFFPALGEKTALNAPQSGSTQVDTARFPYRVDIDDQNSSDLL